VMCNAGGMREKLWPLISSPTWDKGCSTHEGLSSDCESPSPLPVTLTKGVNIASGDLNR